MDKQVREEGSEAQRDRDGNGKASLLLRIIPGVLLMVVVAFLARVVVEPYLEENYPFVVEGLNLNYVLMVIIVGVLIRNTVGIPAWAADGVKMSRLCIKTGIVLLGALYSLTGVLSLGFTAAVLVTSFVLGAAFLTLWLGRKLGMAKSDAAALGAGVGVCGVSAIVATAPAVKAKAAAMGLAVATILSFGIISLFIFPFIGHAVGLSPAEFGAWAGTGILNSGQVLAASLAYDPGAGEASESLLVGQIFNIVRVLILPIVVLSFATYMAYSQAEEEQEHGSQQSAMQIIMNTFPVFVLGFVAMILLSTSGLFGSTDSENASPIIELFTISYSWLFAIGLTGFGMQIAFSEMRRAGGTPFIVGFSVGFLKALLSLIVILLLGDTLFPSGGQFN